MRKHDDLKGSIMIWTLLLGLSLATVFFFYAQRLGENTEQQRRTTQFQAAEALMDSYVGYLENLSAGDLASHKGSIDFHGITGTLTDEALEITGYLDAGEESAEYHFEDEIQIEWNSCSANSQADLVVEDAGETVYSHAMNPCPPGGYDDTEAPVMVHDPFKIKSAGMPFHYRLTSTTPGKKLVDNVWDLQLELPAGFRKTIRMNRALTPTP